MVKDGRIVAMVMEEDFMGIAADLLEERFGGATEANGASPASSHDVAPVENARRRTQ